MNDFSPEPFQVFLCPREECLDFLELIQHAALIGAHNEKTDDSKDAGTGERRPNRDSGSGAERVFPKPEKSGEAAITASPRAEEE
jgi:hypothetical protein